MRGWNETALEAEMRVRQVQRTLGEWLRSYEWTYWLTLTVDGKWSAGRLGPTFEREFVRFATKVSQGPVRFAYVIEGGVLGDQPHLHALLWVRGALDCGRLSEAWRHGRALVQVYDPSRGAAHYLAKEFGKRALDFGMSSRLPPLRVSAATSPAA